MESKVARRGRTSFWEAVEKTSEEVQKWPEWRTAKLEKPSRNSDQPQVRESKKREN